MRDDYDKNKMYKGLVEDVSDYGYEKLDTNNEFDEESSINNTWFFF